jgi:cytochrome P450
MLGDEVDAAVRKYLPPCDDWTEVNINSKVMDIITKVSGRIFVGQDLSQDPEYLECGSMYTFVLFDAVRAIKLVRPWLRPFLVPRLPEMKKLREMEKRAANYLQPIVRERLEAQKNDPNWQKPDDMMQWLLTRSVEKGEVSVEHLAKVQLGLIFAGIHTTTMTATNIVYTLAVTPEYIEPIREEVRNAMHDNDGKITTRALQQMVKLDSYMKEVFRLYPPGLSA